MAIIGPEPIRLGTCSLLFIDIGFCVQVPSITDKGINSDLDSNPDSRLFELDSDSDSDLKNMNMNRNME